MVKAIVARSRCEWAMFSHGFGGSKYGNNIHGLAVHSSRDVDEALGASGVSWPLFWNTSMWMLSGDDEPGACAIHHANAGLSGHRRTGTGGIEHGSHAQKVRALMARSIYWYSEKSIRVGARPTRGKIPATGRPHAV